MRGFKVKFRKNEMNIVPKADIGFMISNRNGNYEITALGIHGNSDTDLMVSTWIDTEIKVGESIQIDVKELKESDQPFSTQKAFSDQKILTCSEKKDMLNEQLETFYVLENLLKKEGVL